jgi:hypothetical protein
MTNSKLTLASYHCCIFTPSLGCAIHRLFILKRGQKTCPIRLIKEKVYKVVMEPYYNTHYSTDTKLLIRLSLPTSKANSFNPFENDRRGSVFVLEDGAFSSFQNYQ